MKYRMVEAWKSFLKLFRFVIWYVIAVAAVLYALPVIGLFLEGKYDVLSSSVKLFTILGFFSSDNAKKESSAPGDRRMPDFPFFDAPE